MLFSDCTIEEADALDSPETDQATKKVKHRERDPSLVEKGVSYRDKFTASMRMDWIKRRDKGSVIKGKNSKEDIVLGKENIDNQKRQDSLREEFRSSKRKVAEPVVGTMPTTLDPSRHAIV
ncbi:hypothetical protein GH714_016907 [Hevea brasiliensis]|uniref:Uncharacterized protein n=1 Tax=Hevea brasiliensis TaxID=3981 RepID=A0A6A6LY13_HEVBR|nr:hypothetical protein GH714_016907 [Hevea brasiliensis]